MAVATAIAIGLAASAAASAGAQVYAAKKSSSAAKQAAQIQTTAVDRAQGINDSVYGPYLNEGRVAASTLGRLTTPGPGARYAAADPTQPRTPRPAPPPPSGGRPMPPGTESTGQAVPRTLGGLARPQGAPQPAAPQGPPQAPPGMVLLEAPDGSGVRPVPAEQADRFIALGARRV